MHGVVIFVYLYSFRRVRSQ